jgi:hypothetical protein
MATKRYNKTLQNMLGAVPVPHRTETREVGRVAGETLHPVGTEIHYTGDMANQPGRGVVVAHRLSANWGDSMDIALDDGREMRGIHLSNFSGPGRRFITWADYQAEREARIEEMRAQYARLVENS